MDATDQVQMLKLRFDHFPKEFQLGDKVIAVDAVERAWQTRAGKAFAFRVRCELGTRTLVQNIQTKQWTISR